MKYMTIFVSRPKNLNTHKKQKDNSANATTIHLLARIFMQWPKIAGCIRCTGYRDPYKQLMSQNYMSKPIQIRRAHQFAITLIQTCSQTRLDQHICSPSCINSLHLHTSGTGSLQSQVDTSLILRLQP